MQAATKEVGERYDDSQPEPPHPFAREKPMTRIAFALAFTGADAAKLQEQVDALRRKK